MAKATEVGQFVPLTISSLRPAAERELGAYGGPSVVRGKRVIDIGAGDGRLALGAARWGAREVLGVDPDPSAVRGARRAARAQRLTNARFRIGAAQELPVSDERYDAAILSWTL